jgi:hypothetical protein
VLMTTKFKGRKSHLGRASDSLPVQKAKPPCLIDLICSYMFSQSFLANVDHKGPRFLRNRNNSPKKKNQLLSRLVRFLHDQNVSVDDPKGKNSLSESGN